jgi:carboxyl-terminal processing protease
MLPTLSVDRQNMLIEPSQLNDKSPRKRRIPLVLVTVTAAILAAFVSLSLRLGLGNFSARMPTGGERTYNQTPRLPTAGDKSQSIITDSVLSIIQGYYVDPERVENRQIIERALAAIATSPRIKVGSSPGAVWLQVDDGEKQFFPLKKSTNYVEVVDVLGAMARIIDDSGIELTYGEIPEKNAPGAVTLLNAVLAELDAHSALLGPEAYRELRQGTEGTFGGLGVLVGIRDHLLTVIKPLPHSPAQRAGIKRNDRILSIGGVFTYGFSLDDLVEYMRGEPGSRVHLSLLRPGASAPSDISLKREVIHVDSVTVKEINQQGLNVLHLTIETFASRTAREVLTAIKKFKLKHNGNLHGVILDLRANPGGLLDQAVQVADLFLESGVIVSTKGRHDEVETAGSGFDEVGFPMAVLIDGDSASASEIVAGALQDHQRAIIVGQPSFGKGSVQTVFELPGERALKLTIARYYTPAGRTIQNVGILPDIWLQPVAKFDQNENLLGTGRYRNERFLKNHLDRSENISPLVQHQPSRKSYYLIPSPPRDDFEVLPRPQDREAEMALKIFDRIRGTYGDHLPKSGARASHWLGLVGPVIRDLTARNDKEVSAWLMDKFKLRWSKPDHLSSAVAPNLKLLLSGTNTSSVTPGDTVNIAWSVHNTEEIPVDRVSVFVRSEIAGIDTRETLIGEIPAKTTKKGVIQITVPPQFPTGQLALRIGVASDAWPLGGVTSDFVVQVDEKPTAQVSVAATLVDDTSGHISGVLEPRESARIRLDVRNDGDIDAANLTVKLVNLSGSQLSVINDSVELEELASGDEKHVYFNVRAAKTMYSSELGFGVSIESIDFGSPFRQRFAVKGLSSSEVSAKPVRIMSH